MKITATKKEVFQPIDINIRIQTEDELQVLIRMSLLNISVADEVVRYNHGKMPDEKIREILSDFFESFNYALTK